MLERHLKSWLKLTYAGNINCVEPAYGSSIGMPDVEISVLGKILPIELKIGQCGTRAKYKISIRPSQRRYHIMAAENGQRTAIMFAVGEFNDFDVYLFNGKYVENDQFVNGNCVQLIARAQDYRFAYVRDILDAHFWMLLDEGRAG